MDILISFVGSRDPFNPSLVDGELQTGPVLTLIAERSFEKIVLFSTEQTLSNSEETRTALAEKYPALDVEVHVLDVIDPTNYSLIIQLLRSHTKTLLETYPDGRFFISSASGTPQMHACWVLLTAAGEIPARLLYVRPLRYVTEDQKLVTEIDLNTDEFPQIKTRPGPILPEQYQKNKQPDPQPHLDKLGLRGSHESFKLAVQTCVNLSMVDYSVLIHGASGTGKEVFARLLHQLSDRADQPFVPVNCASIPENLVESQLFGHKKGAFTGAHRDFKGSFEQADGGILFLDELGDMPTTIQAKLLRVLEDQMIQPLGSSESQKVNVRFIAATNKKLDQAIREGLFREDLYYRLSSGIIRLPTLDERNSDIRDIALHFLDAENKKSGKPKRFATSALLELQNRSWPGNVRQLKNSIQRTVAMNPFETVLEAEHLHYEELVGRPDFKENIPFPSEQKAKLEDFITGIRDHLIKKAIAATTSKTAAARLLGCSPANISKFTKKGKA